MSKMQLGHQGPALENRIISIVKMMERVVSCLSEKPASSLLPTARRDFALDLIYHHLKEAMRPMQLRELVHHVI